MSFSSIKHDRELLVTDNTFTGWLRVGDRFYLACKFLAISSAVSEDLREKNS